MKYLHSLLQRRFHWSRFLATVSITVATAAASAETQEPAIEKPVESIDEILQVLPADMVRQTSPEWTEIQKEAANTLLETTFIKHSRRFRAPLRLSEVARWPGLTFYSEIKTEYGYPIRVFASLSEEWAPKLATLKKGDLAVVEGSFDKVRFRELWGRFGLSVIVTNCTVTLPKPPSENPVVGPTAVDKPRSNAIEPVNKSPQRSLVLAEGWHAPLQGGTMTLEDLAELFRGRGTSSESTAGDPSIMVFENVPFLTPIQKAKELLRLNGKLPSKNTVACPGLPRSSFSYYGFDGLFEGHFNRLYLVTDLDGQVVSAQLVDENPRAKKLVTEPSSLHTYNFVNYRVKALNTLIVEKKVTRTANAVQIVDIVLVNPGTNISSGVNRSAGGSRAQGAKVLEQSRWYVPQPIVNLILRCVEQR